MADFTPQTKYDMGVKYYELVSNLFSMSAELGINAGSGDLRAVRRRLSTLEQWARCIAAVVGENELIKVNKILNIASGKIRGNMIRMSIISDMNKAEEMLYAMMKAHNMLTKMEHRISGEDRARASLGIIGKPRGRSAKKDVDE